MPFHADLHVHSKYSRATSRDLDLEHLAWWAARKGIGVVGTGDCVHPAWLAEIRDKLVPAGGGLFRLRPEIEAVVWKTLPPSCRLPVRFMLSVEISTIYKKGDRTRKIHHLIYAPDFAAADKLAASLGRIGNIASDGRPILGLDSRDLLEIALESGPDSYLVPAHIWTPWFAALGSQSGFDSIADCYGDLADHIFAVETGLSSDPAMNWRVSSLDRYRLTSNSDAHSPGKLGREATRFTCEPDYFAIRRALETGEGYEGTVEFFPEEGKYHMDGHRVCGVRLSPAETIARGGLCPVCGARVTGGVAHRVELLADRSEAEALPPPKAGVATSLVPLPEILSEILDCGVASQAVTRVYDRALAALGPELCVLGEAPVEDIGRADPLLAEAVTRLRSGAVIRRAGYDGEYGVIHLFEEGELSRYNKGDFLFDAPVRRRTRAKARPVHERAARGGCSLPPRRQTRVAIEGRKRHTRRARRRPGARRGGDRGAAHRHRRPRLRQDAHADPSRLAHLVTWRMRRCRRRLPRGVTCTRRAAEELRQRLRALLPTAARDCAVHSFHSLGLAILRAHRATLGLSEDFRIADEAERATALAAALGVSQSKALRLLKAISTLKRTGAAGDAESAEALALCRRLGMAQNWVDFDDLIGLAVEILESDSTVATLWRERFQHICVDEFQDVDEQQYRLLRLLAAPGGNICVIGDPNQAIYGFRGADAACFERFAQDFPGAQSVRLGRNYRSSGTIVKAAARLIGGGTPADIMRPMSEPIALHAAANERMEAEFVAAEIERLLGGNDLLAANKGKAGKGRAALSFADFAVLYRTDAQSAALRAAFDQAGIPFKKSTPAPIAGQAAVRAMLRALEKRPDDVDLATRIAMAAEHLRREGVEADLAALSEARRWLVALAGSGVEALLREHAALATEADFWDPRADRVSLLTMHAAKGLEFSAVFVVGLEDGLTPFSWGEGQENEAEAEERRLFYVAMTRAKDRLFLSRATQRSWRGQIRALPPSPFLRDIPPGLTRQISPSAKRRAEPRQYSLF